jgi:hypothetical protein
MHSWKKWEEEIQKAEFNSIGAATRKRHKLVGKTFVSSRIIHPCLATSRTGLNLDSWLVSLKILLTPFYLYLFDHGINNQKIIMFLSCF